MASFERYTLKSGDIRWRIYWQQPDHRQRNKSGFKTKRDAIAWAAKNIITAINDGAYVDPQGGRMLIGELGGTWIKSHESVWKPSHYKSIETSWRVHVAPKWESRRLSKVQHSEVQQWVNDLAAKRSASVVLRAFGILKGIYEMAQKDGRITKAPTEDIALPRKQRKKHVYLTPQQLYSLADCSGAYRPLILVLGLCGLRWGEATALTVGDVDFKNSRLHVTKSATWVGGDVVLGTPKNGQPRDVPLFDPVAEALRPVCAGRSADELLFRGEHGGYVQQVSIGKNHRCWYKTAIEQSGVPKLTAHDLRHTAASIAVHAGANVKALQRMLGHSSAAMTLDIYADLFERDLDTLISDVNSVVECA